MRCRTSLELAIGVTKPIERFQRTMMPPEKPFNGIAAQSQQCLNLLQKRMIRSVFDFVSTRHMKSGLDLIIISLIKSIVPVLETPLQFQEKIFIINQEKSRTV